ncbi:hypothetical protein, partial [Roseibium sp. RKSG952]|uniref:hypothetical protein n=1 Tax=Roseibium sp. RKSG952 TaxID=2529384 RepID=UPI001AD906FA
MIERTFFAAGGTTVKPSNSHGGVSYLTGQAPKWPPHLWPINADAKNECQVTEDAMAPQLIDCQTGREAFQRGNRPERRSV